MQIVESGRDGVTLLVLEGRLDTATAPEVERWVLPQVAGRALLLDLSAVRFVSSSGLRVLLKTVKAAKAARVGFAICGLQPAVQEVFEIGGFLQIIPTFGTRQEALSSFG